MAAIALENYQKRNLLGGCSPLRDESGTQKVCKSGSQEVRGDNFDFDWNQHLELTAL